MPDWVANILTWRGLSLVIAAIYLGIAIYADNPNGTLITDLLLVGGALLFPLLCIWFGEELGEFYGPLPGPTINRTTPGWMVELGGWVLLLLPAILYPFMIYMS